MHLPVVFTAIAAFYVGNVFAFCVLIMHALFYPYNYHTNLNINLEQGQIELSGTIFTNPYTMKLKVSNVVIILKGTFRHGLTIYPSLYDLLCLRQQ